MSQKPSSFGGATYNTGEPVRDGDMVQLEDSRYGEVIYLFKDKGMFWVRVAMSNGSNQSVELSNVSFQNRKSVQVQTRKKTPPRRSNLPADNLGKYIRTRDLQDVFGWEYGFCKKFIDRLTALDRDYKKGLNLFSLLVSTGLNNMHKLPVITVDSLNDTWSIWSMFRNEIYIRKKTAYAEATSLVLLDAKYKDTPCVVKLLEQVDPQELIVETLINMFMDRNTDDIPEIDSPKVYALCFAKETRRTIVLGKKRAVVKTFNRTYQRDAILNNSKGKALERNDILLVQEKIHGSTFNAIRTVSELEPALITLCKGLYKLQLKFSFSHRDFHSDNVMYCKEKNKAYIIDFGFSCFSIPQTNSSLQAFRGGFGWDQCTDDSIRKCQNHSHDLCTLLLSLYLGAQTRGDTSIVMFLHQICTDICAGYYKQLDTNRIMQLKMQFPDGIDARFEIAQSQIFHYWYTYIMYDIELEEFTPLKMLQRLDPNSTTNNIIKAPALKL